MIINLINTYQPIWSSAICRRIFFIFLFCNLLHFLVINKLSLKIIDFFFFAERMIISHYINELLSKMYFCVDKEFSLHFHWRWPLTVSITASARIFMASSKRVNLILIGIGIHARISIYPAIEIEMNHRLNFTSFIPDINKLQVFCQLTKYIWRKAQKQGLLRKCNAWFDKNRLKANT